MILAAGSIRIAGMPIKKEVTTLISQLKPIHWVLLDLENGLKKRGRFMMADKEFLYLEEQRVMGSTDVFTGKLGQVAQMIRCKVSLGEITAMSKMTAKNRASGSKIHKSAKK